MRSQPAHFFQMRTWWFVAVIKITVLFIQHSLSQPHFTVRALRKRTEKVSKSMFEGRGALMKNGFPEEVKSKLRCGLIWSTKAGQVLKGLIMHVEEFLIYHICENGSMKNFIFLMKNFNWGVTLSFCFKYEK